MCATDFLVRILVREQEGSRLWDLVLGQLLIVEDSN